MLSGRLSWYGATTSAEARVVEYRACLTLMSLARGNKSLLPLGLPKRAPW